MKDKDVLAKEYMSVSERFADVVNVGVFKGKQVLTPGQIQEIDTSSNFTIKSDMKTVCRFIQSSGDDKKIEKMLKEHREEFENMAEDTYDLIGVFGDMEAVHRLKEECKQKEGGYNMCKGMEDWLKRKEEEGRQEGRTEGLEQGIKALIETCKEFGIAGEDVMSKVKDKFGIEDAKAQEYFARYWG